MRAVVLGCTGTIGRRVAVELARRDEVEELTVAGRDESRVGGLADALGGSKRGVRPAHLDLDHAGGLREIAAEGDVVVSCLGPTYSFELRTLRAALEVGADHVSLCDDHEVVDEALAVDGEARTRGSSAIVGCGLSPGLTNLLARLAAEPLSHVDDIELSVGVAAADPSGPAAAVHLFAMFSEPRALVVSDGRRAHESSPPRPTYLPQPVGWVETFARSHPEVITLARRWPAVRSIRYRFGLTERALMDTVRALSATPLARRERTRRLLVRATYPARPIFEHLPPAGARWSGARVDVHGERGGRRTTESLAVVDHLDTLAALPLVEAALALGGGEVSAGVHAAEDVLEPGPFLSKLSKRGIRVARLEPIAL